MSAAQKEWISKWLPLVIAIASNLILVAYGYGKLEQRLGPLETHVATDTTEHALNMFVTRVEFTQQNLSRDKELAELRIGIREMNAKLDRLLERSK